jgi:hypothetical protein
VFKVINLLFNQEEYEFRVAIIGIYGPILNEEKILPVEKFPFVDLPGAGQRVCFKPCFISLAQCCTVRPGADVDPRPINPENTTNKT